MSGLFNVAVDRSLLEQASKNWPSYVVMTTPTPWNLARGKLKSEPAGVAFVESLEIEELDKLLGTLPDADVVVAIGGAGCQEAAKYYGRKRNAERIHVPTVVSNNAALCTVNTLLSNDARDVTFNCDPPKTVLYDTDIVRAAQPFVNRSGLGEHLCVHTGLYDWRLASSKGLGLPWKHGLARQMAHLVMRALAVAPKMRQMSDDAIHELVAIWVRVGELIDEYSCMNFTGASEHVFALNLVRVRGKRLIHGQTVGLGVVVMSFIQRNCPEVMAEALATAGARFKPEDIGCTWDDVAETLRTLPEHAKRMRGDAPYSKADEVEYSSELLATIRDFIEPYPTPTDDGWVGR